MRRFARVTVALLLLCSTELLDANDRVFVNETYEIVNAGDGIFVFLAPEPNSSVVQGNSVLIVGQDAALVVDSGQFPSLAERMVKDVRRLTDKPLRFLVNTHWHFDHIGGNRTYLDAFPGLAIVGTQFTRRMAATQSQKDLESALRDGPVMVERLRAMLANGTASSGRPLTDEEKDYLAVNADTLEHIQGDLERARVTPPTVAFEKSLSIDLGGREVLVLWLGRANTAGDAVVWVPDISLLVTGDTVILPVPFAFGSHMFDWGPTLRRMIALEPRVIVPGHGPILKDTARLEELVELFADLEREVRAGVSEGLTLEEVRARVTLASWKKRLAGDTPAGDRFWRTFLPTALERAYQEATGTLPDE